MHLQVLSSGSQGNATLVRAGELHLLVDAGLPCDALFERFEAARVAPRRLDLIALTHGHLDHARASGELASKTGARVLCSEKVMQNASVRRAPRMAAFTVGRPHRVEPSVPRPGPDEELEIVPVRLPHDADPTVAFRIVHRTDDGARTAVILTDMGKPDADAARALAGAHLLVLEFNHDPEMLRTGPYPRALRKRVGGDFGHLSNEQAQSMLRRLAGPDLHTLVLAHLSATNNTPELALACARATLEAMGLGHVQVLVARQDEVGPNLAV